MNEDLGRGKVISACDEAVMDFFKLYVIDDLGNSIYVPVVLSQSQDIFYESPSVSVKRVGLRQDKWWRLDYSVTLRSDKSEYMNQMLEQVMFKYNPEAKLNSKLGILTASLSGISNNEEMKIEYAGPRMHSTYQLDVMLNLKEIK